MRTYNIPTPRMMRKAARCIVASVGLSNFLQAQDNRCYLCNGVFDCDPNNPITIDHVFPLCAVFKNAGNLLLAHKKCNNDKKDQYPTSYQIAFLGTVNTELQYDANTHLYRRQDNYTSIIIGRSKYGPS